METVRDGLGFYAKIKTYGIIFVGVLILISAIGFLYNTIKGNYKRSPSSKISYLTNCNEEEIKNNTCKKEIIYTDGTNTYKNNLDDSKLSTGEVTLFYKEHDPHSYQITENLYIFPGFFSCVACGILIFGIARLMIIRSSKNAAAFMGGLDGLDDTGIINSVFN